MKASKGLVLGRNSVKLILENFEMISLNKSVLYFAYSGTFLLASLKLEVKKVL